MTIAQSSAVILSIPGLGFLGPVMLMPPGYYLRGLIQKKHRYEYEETMGNQIGGYKFGRIAQLRRLVTAETFKPDAVVHFAEDLPISADERNGLLTAAYGKTAVSVDLLKSMERFKPYRQINLLDDPTASEMRFDMIYHYDHERREPVLITVDRFRRNQRLPSGPRRKKTRAESQTSADGDWLPAGAR
jgi:hypothetical protein